MFTVHWYITFAKICKTTLAHFHIASKMSSSRLHRPFIEFSCTNFSMKRRWSFSDSHFKFILFFWKKLRKAISLKNSCMTTKNSMRLRWNVDEASMTPFSMLCVNGLLLNTTWCALKPEVNMTMEKLQIMEL